MKKLIYMDHAATTKTAPEVLQEMLPYFTESYGNPSAFYGFAGEARKAVDKARDIIAKAIGATSQEIYFTGGGTEADNWALIATAEGYAHKGKHIITSTIEHHAILHTCKYLEKRGFEITYVNVDQQGMVPLEELEQAIRQDTILISIMAANNEIGTIQPLEKIGELAKKHGILFHTDGVQAFGHIPLSVKNMHIDMLSASGHKINGPKGIGILYIRKGLKIGSFIHGGAQERRKRAGTSNVAGIVGMGKATELAQKKQEETIKRVTELRNYFVEKVLNKIPYTRLNGHPIYRLPNNVNVSFSCIEGESLLILLEQAGICASSGSACTSGSLELSHVLLAIGLSYEMAGGSLRFTLSEENTKEEVDYVVERLAEIVKRLREMSPSYREFLKKHLPEEQI